MTERNHKSEPNCQVHWRLQEVWGSKPPTKRRIPFVPWCDPKNPIGPPKAILVEGVDVRSPEFLRTRAWRTLRYRALREGGTKCECCGARPRDGVRLNVDHIQPRKLRPDLALDPWNLQILWRGLQRRQGQHRSNRLAMKAPATVASPRATAERTNKETAPARYP